MGVVDIAVLVRQAVARVVPDELDVARKLVGAADAGVGGGHLVAVIDGVHPLVHGDGRLHRVLERKAADEADGRACLALSGVRARKADLADEDGQHADGAAGVLAVGVTLRPPALRDERGLGCCDLVCERADGVGGNLRDGGGPFGGLLHHVVALAHEVGAIGLVLPLGALGHRLLVVAHAIGVQEFEVDLVVHHPFVRDGACHGGVGARTDGQPLVGMARRAFVEAVVDVDDAAAALIDSLAHAGEIPHDVRPAHARFSGAVAEHHHEVGVELGFGHRRREHVVVGAAILAVQKRQCGREHVRRVVVHAAQAASQHVEQTRRGVARRGVHARSVDFVDGLVAVRVDDALELAGDGVDGLVPADLLELALTALADALHGLRQAVGVVEPAAHGAAAQAGACLQGVVAGVVGFHVDDLAIAAVPLEYAAAAAVHIALAPGDLVGGRVGCAVRAVSLALRRASVERGAGRPGKRKSCERPFDERAARQRRFACGHGSLLWFGCSSRHDQNYRNCAAGESHRACDLREKPQVDPLASMKTRSVRHHGYATMLPVRRQRG